MCDNCGKIVKNKFTYYSAEFHKVMVNSSSGFSQSLGKDFDIDVCEECYDKLVETAKKNISYVKNGVKCSLSSQVMTGTYDFWRMIFDKVTVDTSSSDTVSVINKVMDFDLGINAVNSFKNKCDSFRREHENSV